MASLKRVQDFKPSLLFVLNPGGASPNVFHSSFAKPPKEVPVHNTPHWLYNSDTNDLKEKKKKRWNEHEL